MQTIETIQEQASSITNTAQFISSSDIDIRTIKLYLMEKDYYLITYRRSLNFMDVEGVEKITLNKAKILFDDYNWQ